MTLHPGLIESLELDRVNFKLTLTVWQHPRGRGDPRVIVESFDSLQPLLDRYDELVAESEDPSEPGDIE